MFKLKSNEQEAYEWALSQQYNSVAAQYARLLAQAVKQSENRW